MAGIRWLALLEDIISAECRSSNILSPVNKRRIETWSEICRVILFNINPLLNAANRMRESFWGGGPEKEERSYQPNHNQGIGELGLGAYNAELTDRVLLLLICCTHEVIRALRCFFYFARCLFLVWLFLLSLLSLLPFLFLIFDTRFFLTSISAQSFLICVAVNFSFKLSWTEPCAQSCHIVINPGVKISLAKLKKRSICHNICKWVSRPTPAFVQIQEYRLRSLYYMGESRAGCARPSLLLYESAVISSCALIARNSRSRTGFRDRIVFLVGFHVRLATQPMSWRSPVTNVIFIVPIKGANVEHKCFAGRHIHRCIAIPAVAMDKTRFQHAAIGL